MASQRDRLEALLDQQEASVRRAFEAFIRGVNSELVLRRIADHLERGDVNGALAIVESYIVRFADVLPAIQQVVGIEAAAELAEIVGDTILAIGFDPSHPRAAQLARASRLSLIREMVDDQRLAIRNAISAAFEQGTGTAGIARAFRGAIGLTSGQEQWVRSFETQLRELDARVLSRALRDRRYDRTLERVLRDRTPLSERQIEAMVERYRARALIYRSENIARTEALRATSQAREEALRQMVEQTRMDPARVRRVWNAVRDARTRDAHRDMQGQETTIEEPFVDGEGNQLMWPGDPSAPAETTINCRCTVTFRILPLESTRAR